MIWSAVLSAFLASTVEFVEALTIVLAVGVTINWRSSLAGAAAAFLLLAGLVAFFGSALIQFIPLEWLRIVVGIVLLLFGLQWLKKAVLRYSGHKGLHDEAAIYAKKQTEMERNGKKSHSDFDFFGFLTSFKSVLLEGTEVVFIVVTFGINAAANRWQGIESAAMGALLAFFLICFMGMIARKPLTKIPENTLKFSVAILLISFGTFWSGEGLGIEWPGEDQFLVALAGFYLLVSWWIIRWLQSSPPRPSSGKKSGENPPALLAVFQALFDFFCGDWNTFFGVMLVVATVVWLGQNLLLTALLPLIYVLGICASFVVAVRR